jgi:hypothetical protein
VKLLFGKKVFGKDVEEIFQYLEEKKKNKKRSNRSGGH